YWASTGASRFAAVTCGSSSTVSTPARAPDSNSASIRDNAACSDWSLSPVSAGSACIGQASYRRVRGRSRGETCLSCEPPASHFQLADGAHLDRSFPRRRNLRCDLERFLKISGFNDVEARKQFF